MKYSMTNIRANPIGSKVKQKDPPLAEAKLFALKFFRVGRLSPTAMSDPDK